MIVLHTHIDFYWTFPRLRLILLRENKVTMIRMFQVMKARHSSCMTSALNLRVLLYEVKELASSLHLPLSHAGTFTCAPPSALAQLFRRTEEDTVWTSRSRSLQQKEAA